MAKFEGKVNEVVENAEVVSIATCDADGPHMVATWGDYVRAIGIQNQETIVIPTGGYRKTEENLKKNDKVEVLIGSKQVEGSRGPGAGFLISGRGKIETSGEFAELAKSKFAWARGALVIRVDEITSTL